MTQVSGISALPLVRRVLSVLLAVFLAAPVIVLAISLYGQHGMLFWDAKTIPCGLLSVIDSGTPNAYLNNPNHSGACAGYGYEYMLPPAVTAVLVQALQWFGLNVLIIIYGFFYAASIIFLVYSGRRFAGDWWRPVLFTLLLSCGVFVFEFGGGNLTVPFLGGLFALILAENRVRHWEAVIATICVLAAAFKPLYALYLLIPLYAGAAWFTVSAAAAVVSTAYALDAWWHPEAFARWLELSVTVVYGEPHFGVMRLMQDLGLGRGDWWVQGAGFLVWCLGIAYLLWRVRPQLESRQERALAALLAVTLMQPRFKEYDAVVLIPLLFWLLARLRLAAAGGLKSAVLWLCLVTPAGWWWGRKIWLLTAVPSPTLIQIADPRWLIGTQGFFLGLLALLMFGALCLHCRLATAAVTPD